VRWVVDTSALRHEIPALFALYGPGLQLDWMEAGKSLGEPLTPRSSAILQASLADSG
jgi:hypothetical protein